MSKELHLKQLHSEIPEIDISEDRKQVWIEDWLVWDDGHFISPNRRYQK